MDPNRCLITKCIFNSGFPMGYCQVDAKECKLREEGQRNLEKALQKIKK